jgi:hypothetical protein
VRSGFDQACIKAGYPDLIFHDTRRSAVRRMEECGIPRRQAMQITGHLTEHVYKRYDIGAEAEATQAGRKLWEYERQRNDEKFANRFANEPEAAGGAGESFGSGKCLN